MTSHPPLPSDSLKDPMQASFSVLVMSLASSASFSMGLVPHPETGEKKVDLELAKFNIDLLMILQEKTRGNLSSEEKLLLEAVLTDLQTQYIQSKKKENSP